MTTAQNTCPLHIAIIPDGNRRWARARGLPAWRGHERAMRNFRSVMEWCRKRPDIGTLTLWCFSTENWKRPAKEVTKLMNIYELYLKRERVTLLKNRTRLLHSGRTDRLRPSLRALLADIAADTAGDHAFTLHIALDYGGKDEIVRAVQRIAAPAAVSEEAIRAQLDHPELPDIDLVIRTSGEVRTSNFFLWQSVYSEWVFLEKFFPDFRSEDVASAIDEYHRRKRRFGG